MIICAAVRIKMKDSGNIATIHCMRHHYAFEILHDLGIKPTDYERVCEGFIDHRGNFLDRKDAYIHAKECGQVPAQLVHDKTLNDLFSEDLW